MAKCQSAVPAWIMTIGKAIETLDPRFNKFDVIIIDEAIDLFIYLRRIVCLRGKISLII